jgi:anti-sigma-K factor RskA
MQPPPPPPARHDAENPSPEPAPPAVRRVYTLPRFGAARLIAATAIIVMAVGLALYALDQKQRATTLARRVDALVEAERRLQQELTTSRDQLADRDAFIGTLTKPGLRIIDVHTPGARGASTAASSGRMFWDQPANTWTLVAHRLEQPAAGHVYQLWLVTRDQRTVSAGTFTARPDGDITVTAYAALAPGALAAVMVTEEPAGGSAAPTSAPVLTGTARAGS